MSGEKKQRIEQLVEGLVTRYGTEIEHIAESEGITGKSLAEEFISQLSETFQLEGGKSERNSHISRLARFENGEGD